jgi:hypothetical protein
LELFFFISWHNFSDLIFTAATPFIMSPLLLIIQSSKGCCTARMTRQHSISMLLILPAEALQGCLRKMTHQPTHVWQAIGLFIRHFQTS